MSEFLSSIKADLLDRRMLPLVAIVAVLLVGAIGFVVFGGSGSSTHAVAASTGSVTVGGLTTSPATHEQAVAETTNDTAAQHGGNAHNPFTPLPTPKAKTASSASSVSSTASSTPASGSTSSGSSATSPSEPAPATPATPAKPKTSYHVAVLFGIVPVGETAQTVQLTPYENLKLLTPLPSNQPLVVYRGVTAGGKSATFTLVGEAILHGNGTCLPSASQCQAVDLQPGQAEQLEYLPPSGQTVTYELRVVTIASFKASAASLGNVLRGESKSGRALLRRNGLLSLPFLRLSSQPGVLVFAAHPASAASAHAAGQPHHRR
jgi:hypothetical protein